MLESKKIVVNTFYLYFKLILTTLVGIYSTYIIIQEIGPDAFGLYSLVGGIVFLIAVLNSAMLSTTNRFIAVEIGKGSKGDINKIFNSALVIHLGLSLLFILSAEIIGGWYIRSSINVESKYINDVNYIFQTSVIATFFYIISVPYQGLLIAKEIFFVKLIIEVIGDFIKLGLLFFILHRSENKLRSFADVMMVVILIQSVLFILFCVIKEKKSIKWKFNNSISDYSSMFSFTGWTFLGTISHIGSRQGIAVLVNLFFGITMNAAYGLSTQVYNYIQLFVTNISQAAIPQIMKSQSAGHTDKSLFLAYSIAKISFFAMLIPAIPLLLSLDTIFTIWLNKVPSNTVLFTYLLVINGFIGVLGSSFNPLVQATGIIKKYQLWYAFSMLSVIPVVFIFYRAGLPAYFFGIVTILSSILFLFVQMSILQKLTNFKKELFYSKTIKPIILVLIAVAPQFYLREYFGQNILDVIYVSFVSVLLILVSIYFFGLSNDEKNLIKYFFNKIKYSF
jgi:O-antigen/teichoic acid export membrane protein